MDYFTAGYPATLIREKLCLTDAQVDTAVSYIKAHQADADLKQAIVTGTLRRRPRLDFRSANEAELEGVGDSDILAIGFGNCRTRQ